MSFKRPPMCGLGGARKFAAEPKAREEYRQGRRGLLHLSADKDGRAPAMRLGFAKQPLEFEDLVWPRERVPRQLTLAIHATGD